jgi:hypothetical protein
VLRLTVRICAHTEMTTRTLIALAALLRHIAGRGVNRDEAALFALSVGLIRICIYYSSLQVFAQRVS